MTDHAPSSTLRYALATAALAAAAAAAPARVAHASGLEIPDNGAVAMGRGGAFVARASDPSALIHNVAGLVGLPGFQFTVAANAGVFNHCWQREGNYQNDEEVSIQTAGTLFENSGYARARDPDTGNALPPVPYPRVCREPGVSPTPHLAFSWRITPRLAIGFGVYGPNTTGSGQTFPDTEMTRAGIAPSPARYLVFHKRLLALHITLATSYQITDWLRFGVALQPSFASFELGTMINTAPGAAQSPDTDVRSTLRTSGWFLAGNIGVQVLPSRYFSFAAHAHINPEVHLRGQGSIIANYYSSDRGPMTCNTTAERQRPRCESTFNIDRMTIPLPMTFRAGARFALPRPGRPTQNDPSSGAYDPMNDDVFDLEAVLNYETTSRMSNVTLENSGSINLAGTMVPAPATVIQRSDFRDVIGVRVGGDYNALPGRLAVRAGAAYETAAMSNEFAQIHLPGYETFSVHGGVSVRFWRLTATLAYAHYFMSDFNANMGMRGVTSVGGTLMRPAPGQPGRDPCAGGTGSHACMINRGVYQASYDAISVGITGAF